MRASVIGLSVCAVLSAGSASAFDNPYASEKLFKGSLFASPAPPSVSDDPGNCGSVTWDDNAALTVARVKASPRVNFIKSPYDDDGKAVSCPAATEACRKASYLVTDDMVLVGKSRDGFTCVSYQWPQAKEHRPTVGWLPSAALMPVPPTPSPGRSDWLGNWTKPGGGIDITEGGIGGRLLIDGIMFTPTAHDVHNGALDAMVMPGKDSIAFLEDGWLPFETRCDSGCRVRMHRIGPWLLVEDNGDCGGAGVTFTGLYRRAK